MRCFRTRGKKGDEHCDPVDPPRCRANHQRGRDTSANDRPPVLGTVGRETGQARLRVAADTKGVTLRTHAEPFTRGQAILNTDEYQSYNGGRGNTLPSVMTAMHGRAMTTAMAFIKSIAT